MIYRTLILLLCFPLFVQAQVDADTLKVMDVSKLYFTEELIGKAKIGFIGPEDDLAKSYPAISFSLLKNDKTKVPGSKVTQKVIIEFAVTNTSDSLRRVWFFPGFYYKNVQLYEKKDGRLLPIASVFPREPYEYSYRLLEVPAHTNLQLVAELHFLRVHLSSILPRLISLQHYSAYVSDIRNTNIESKTMTYVFCGLLLMMIFYSLSTYVQEKNKEFLYYALYAFSLGVMLFTKAFYSYRTSEIGFFNESYFDFILQSAGHMFYMFFMQRYLSAKTQHPFLYKFYKIGIVLSIVSMVLFTWAHYCTYDFLLENRIENSTKIILLVMVIVFLVYSGKRWDDRLLRYLFWGNFWLFIFSAISMLFVLRFVSISGAPDIFTTGLFYYEVGLLLELVFFMAGLYYKNKKRLIKETGERERLRAENQMKEYEKEIAVYKAQKEERERISADMHDELGSGMTAIRLMSEIAKNKMKQNTPVEIEKISQSADEVLNKMNAIIWSMDNANDTLDNLISYIRSYALEYFENTPIDCKVYLPGGLPTQELTGDKRRNLFLCVKETLTNALKHSQATSIILSFAITGNELVLEITDDGVGADFSNKRQYGNGIKNIQKRMNSIGGTFRMDKKNGTQITLTAPL